MRYVFAAEMVVCSAVAVIAADQGEHAISYCSALLMLFCLWMVDRYRRES